MDEQLASHNVLSLVHGHPVALGAIWEDTPYRLLVVGSQLGDFDTLEYAWWLLRDREELHARGVTVRFVGIGAYPAGERFCAFTQMPRSWLFLDPEAKLHQALHLYRGLTLTPNGFLNLMLMCAGLGSPGTLGEVLRGYTGDRRAPALFAADELVVAPPLPPLRGRFFRAVGTDDHLRPLELATLRLRHMGEVLGHWSEYVTEHYLLTQRGGTFLWDRDGTQLYAHRDHGVLGFAAYPSRPLDFVAAALTNSPSHGPSQESHESASLG
jgi:hypothetical protein